MQNFGTFQSYIQVRNISTFDVGTDSNQNVTEAATEDDDLDEDQNEELVIINKKPTDIPPPQDERDQAMKIDIDKDGFQFVKSSCSCKVKDIKAITYGCMSSRFWLLRKHVNSIQRKT